VSVKIFVADVVVVIQKIDCLKDGSYTRRSDSSSKSSDRQNSDRDSTYCSSLLKS
jgi:hypothetical protein